MNETPDSSNPEKDSQNVASSAHSEGAHTIDPKSADTTSVLQTPAKESHDAHLQSSRPNSVETIAAIATAGGNGSIAIVRLSGSRAFAIARVVAPRAKLQPRHAQLTMLYDLNNDAIDQGIVLAFSAPHSYTGEDVVEFQCHGGLIIARRILETLLNAGAQLAEPGAFSKRAFLNGKIDLAQAEAIARMIEAKSVRGAQLLARHLQGELGRYVERIREALIRILAHVEVTIDYAEELDASVERSIVDQLQELIASAQRLVESSRRRQGLLDGFRVAIIGKPNVGKSSLLNAMLAYDRAIVSTIAGTTRDTIEETLMIGEHAVRLIDTAGIRQSDDAIEQIGVARSVASLQDADLVLALFDGSRPLDEDDKRVISLLTPIEQERICLFINKTDLPQQLDTAPLQRWHPTALSLRAGAASALNRLEEQLDRMSDGEEMILVSARQIDAVERLLSELMSAHQPLQEGALELCSYHIRAAIDAIGSITHPFEDHEMLDQMFGEFCLGK
jgi:tRNA modification GTPase